MPNYIKNVVTFQQNEKYINQSLSFEQQILLFKEEINTKLLPMIINKNNDFDFEILIPTDPTNWYNFNIANWGCKWNAGNCDFLPEGVSLEEYIETELCNTFTFDTAWSTPFNYFKTLSKKFPQFDIHVLFADEDTGYNCGFYIFNNGDIIQAETQHSNPEKNWKKFALQLWYGSDVHPLEFGLNENFEYDEHAEQTDDDNYD